MLCLQKKQLDEGMIFFFYNLPNDAFGILQEIYQLYEACKLAKVPRSKCGASKTKLDCRGCNFKGLHNLDVTTVVSLLEEVKSGMLPFMSLNSACKEIKKLCQLMAEFVRLVGASSWEDTQDKFPEFADEGKLKYKFIGMPFSRDMPAWNGELLPKAIR